MFKKIVLTLTIGLVLALFAATGTSLLVDATVPVTSTNHVDMGTDRIVEVYNVVDFALAENVIRKLRRLDAEDPNKEIIVRIVSPGGGVYAGLMIIDAMHQVRAPIRTVCEGMCASMGAIILASGDPGKRNSMPNAMILIHSVGGGAEGRLPEVELQLEEMRRLQAISIKILSGGDPARAAIIAELLKKDTILTPLEAQSLGLIDSVL